METSTLLLCAAAPEWKPLSRLVSFRPLSRQQGVVTYEGKDSPVRLCQFGMGVRNASIKMPAILDDFRGKEVKAIHFGISGGLVDSLSTGTVILATHVVGEDGPPCSIGSPFLEEAESHLKDLSLPYVKGGLFTSSVVLETPEEKRRTGLQTGCVAVDMETYPVAKMCGEREIPFISIRSIFDPVVWDLSELKDMEFVNNEWAPSYAKAAKTLLTHPGFIFSLPKYQQAMKRAAENLALLVFRLLQAPQMTP